MRLQGPVQQKLEPSGQPELELKPCQETRLVMELYVEFDQSREELLADLDLASPSWSSFQISLDFEGADATSLRRLALLKWVKMRFESY